MKKSLLALAVLGAFTSIASAQSSVTLYGRIDENVTLQDPGRNQSANGTSRNGSTLTKLQDGSINGFGGSRLGFKATEDLGNGLKAFFTLEAGVSPDSGGAGGSTTLGGSTSSFFNRLAILGLRSDSLGEVRLGRQESLTRENAVKINDISGDNELKLSEKLEKTTEKSGKGTRALFQDFGTRVDNGIRYTTPVFSGLQASVIVGLGEKQTTLSTATPPVITGKAANYRGLSVVYAAGPLALDVIYEDLRGGAVGHGDYNNVITAGGSYDFSIVKVAAAYQHTNNFGGQLYTLPYAKGPDINAWNVGLAVPLNAFTFKVQYTGSSIDKIGTSPSLDQSKYGASLSYALSKRTTVYAVATTRAGDNKESYSRKSEYAMGIGHTF